MRGRRRARKRGRHRVLRVHRARPRAPSELGHAAAYTLLACTVAAAYTLRACTVAAAYTVLARTDATAYFLHAEPYLISSADPATTLSSVGTPSLILSVVTATYPRCAHSDVGAFGKDTP